jgi:hypothetical protein
VRKRIFAYCRVYSCDMRAHGSQRDADHLPQLEIRG